MYKYTYNYYTLFYVFCAITNKTNLKYAEGTGCNVFYNNSVVFIHLNASGVTAANDEIITKIVLPEGIGVKLYRAVWILTNLMGSNWIPTNEAIYLSFGDAHTLKSPAFRVKSGSVSNATIAGTYVFPRDLFDIT